MIVSHSRRFVFLKPTKAAGSTVQAILSLHCDSRDIVPRSNHWTEHPALARLRPYNYRLPLRGNVRGYISQALRGTKLPSHPQHATAKYVKQLLGETTWNDYKKISVVRNPFDRIVSWYYWTSKGGYRDSVPFEDYVLDAGKILTSPRRQYFIEGLEVADWYVRVEHMESDLAILEEQHFGGRRFCHLAGELILKRNPDPRRKTTEELFSASNIAVEFVSKTCEWEISRFNYTWCKAK